MRAWSAWISLRQWRHSIADRGHSRRGRSCQMWAVSHSYSLPVRTQFWESPGDSSWSSYWWVRRAWRGSLSRYRYTRSACHIPREMVRVPVRVRVWELLRACEVRGHCPIFSRSSSHHLRVSWVLVPWSYRARDPRWRQKSRDSCISSYRARITLCRDSSWWPWSSQSRWVRWWPLLRPERVCWCRSFE